MANIPRFAAGKRSGNVCTYSVLLVCVSSESYIEHLAAAGHHSACPQSLILLLQATVSRTPLLCVTSATIDQGGGTDQCNSPMSGDIKENLPIAETIFFINSRILSRSASSRPSGCIFAAKDSAFTTRTYRTLNTDEEPDDDGP